MDKNRDNTKYNCYFLAYFTVVNVRDVKMSEELLIAYACLAPTNKKLILILSSLAATLLIVYCLLN